MRNSDRSGFHQQVCTTLRRSRWLACVGLALMAAGCLHVQKDPLSRSGAPAPITKPYSEWDPSPASAPTTVASTGPATRTATTPSARSKKPRHLYLADDPALATTAYWFRQPTDATVGCGEFDVLWNAAQIVLRDSGFTADRLDYREGLLTSIPLSSKQVFEIWKIDVADSHSLSESTLSSVRRTVHFQISKEPDGHYQCVIKAVVERQSSAERRITSVRQYRDIFSAGRAVEDGFTDEGNPVQLDYWYAFRRDPALEKRLAQSLRERMAGQNCDN